MKDENAARLLANVMGWEDESTVRKYVPLLQLLATYKYDSYQRFQPGKRFVESFALWLRRFDRQDRQAAFELIFDKLVFFSDAEFSHLVTGAYPDVIVQEQLRLVAEEYDIEAFRIAQIARHRRFRELALKSLYLGLSDGARTSELRRASNGVIRNEQISHAYEIGDEKTTDMIQELTSSLAGIGICVARPAFNLVWLLDDFSGSGHTYIRYDQKGKRFKGKIKKAYEVLHRGLVDATHYEVFLLLYVATQQAVDHIEYWSDRFTSERGYKPLQVRVLCPLGAELVLHRDDGSPSTDLAKGHRYYDENVHDRHLRVGGTTDARFGFAGCGLPVVLCHNTPNNSLYLLWGGELTTFPGLFPRVSRHQGD